MNGGPAFGGLDPVDISEVERVSFLPVFEELRQEIVAEPPLAGGLSDDVAGSVRLRDDRRARRQVPAFTVAAVILLVAALLVFGGGSGGLKGPITTPWQPARPLSAAAQEGGGREQGGTWRLVDDLLRGTWQQNTSGPPPGYLSCPSVSTCYAMSGHYRSADANAPLLSESLYVSTDAGSTWSELPMPRDFAPTSPIACGGASDCTAGGTYKGQPVLVVTRDGGHSFTIEPLPNGDGSLYALSCPSVEFCAGLAATSADSNSSPIDATFLSTSNGGSTFTDFPILVGDSMQSLACVSSLDCTVVGISDAFSKSDPLSGVTGMTRDSGRSWTAGRLPAGFGTYLSQISCADAFRCSVTGNIAIIVKNPPQCASRAQHQVPGTTTTTQATSTTVPSPSVQAVARAESRAATDANRQAADQKIFACSFSDQAVSGDIASTSDGGLTWRPDPMPADVPQPTFWGLVCPSVNECWAAGSAAIPQKVGNASNGGSSVLLGTTDGGSTWSKVTFSVPAGAPNYDGQSYLSMGLISCPSSGVCVALGAAAQSAPSAPVYSLVVPASERAAS